MNNRFDPIAQIAVLALVVIVLLVLVMDDGDVGQVAVGENDAIVAEVVEDNASDDANDGEVPIVESDTSAEVVGDAAHGESLFVSNACSACHITTSDDPLVGPGLLTIADRAGSRVEGMTAVEYIRESITNPTAFVVEGFPPAMTPFNFLSEPDVDDLIAYLLSL